MTGTLQIHWKIHGQFMKGSAHQNEVNALTLPARNDFLCFIKCHNIGPGSQGCIFSPSDTLWFLCTRYKTTFSGAFLTDKEKAQVSLQSSCVVLRACLFGA